MSSLPLSRYTPEQYLEMERKAEHRSEYRNGEIVPVAASNRWRSRIITNLPTALSKHLTDGPGEVLALAMRLKMTANGSVIYTYPDVLVTGKFAYFEDSNQDSLLNPIIVADVFAAQNAAVNIGLKMRDYANLLSLKEYVSLFTERPEIYHWQSLPKREWSLRVCSGLASSAHLESIVCELPLSQIYARVAFEPDPLMPNDFELGQN